MSAPHVVTLTSYEHRVLAALADRAAGATLAELGADTGLFRSTVRKHVTSLERWGYAFRQQAASGSAPALLVLTADGRAALERGWSA